uniref:Uncharacterized protein n=1 Tax=Rhizophora mucronata TaxID=61149 RepID=A0A2P2M4F1_RHIMU
MICKLLELFLAYEEDPNVNLIILKVLFHYVGFITESPNSILLVLIYSGDRYPSCF